MLAVALVAEGAELRAAGVDVDVPIVVLSQASPSEVDDLVAHRLGATGYTADGIAALAAAAADAGRVDDPVDVHLKVDTGMHRVGARPDDVVGLARSVGRASALRLASVFTHFAVADEPDDPYTAEQTARYRAVLDDLAAARIDVPLRHAANTAGAIAHPDARFDLVRVGIGIYGLAPSPETSDLVRLRPAMSLRARVSHVKRIGAGDRVSYGLRYRADRPTTIATVPLGYADGVTRSLADGGEVLIGGRRHPIAGTITMDQLMVDCGDHPVEVGDEVVLFGRQGDELLPVDEWAARVGTITYEIVCGIGPRVPRRHLEGPPPP